MKIQIPLKLSLIILPLVPLAAFMFVSFNQFQANLADLKIINNQGRNSTYISEASQLVLYLQRERGISATHISGGGKQVSVAENRSAVDKSLESLGPIYENTSFFSRNPSALDEVKAAVEVLRTDVNNRSISFPEVMEGYSNVVNLLFALNNIAAQEKTTGGIGKLFSSINILQDSQEAAGRFRGYVSSVVSADESISEGLFLVLMLDFDSMKINITSSGVILTEQSKQVLNDLMHSESWMSVEGILKTLSMRYRSGGYGWNQNTFWDNSTEIVDGIHEIIVNEIDSALKKNAAIEQDIKTNFTIQLAILIVTSLIVLTLSIIIIVSIARRIGKVSGRLEEMSTGSSDLTVEIPVDANDDIGTLAIRFNSYVASLRQLIKKIQDAAVGLSGVGRELVTQIAETGEAKDYISANLDIVQSNVDVQSRGMDRLADGITVFTDTISDLSAAIEEQAAAVTESSASIEEMIANINMVTKSLDNTSKLINELDSESRQGGELIDQVTSEIRLVSEQSSALQEANEMIAGIADQTNLLAMNAAIEAAHAGEAGKGFSVVADEIRRLAETSSEQSRVISQNIKTITESISTVVDSASQTESSFSHIINKVRDVSALQEGIRGAMSEQNYGSTEILNALASLNENSQKVSGVSERMTETGGEMSDEISQVKNAADRLQDSVKAMGASVVQIEAVLYKLGDIVKQNENYIEGLNEKTNSFILE